MPASLTRIPHSALPHPALSLAVSLTHSHVRKGSGLRIPAGHTPRLEEKHGTDDEYLGQSVIMGAEG